MNIEEIRDYCLSLPAATEDFPFDESVLAVRIKGKIFTLVPLDSPGQMNLKCDPERAVQLREQYDGIQPGYHMNKQHWNTVHFDKVPDKLVKDLIRHSYDLIVAALPKKIRDELGG